MLTKKVTLLAASLLISTSALAYDINERGDAAYWKGTCHSMTVADQEAPLCNSSARVWLSKGMKRYVFMTSIKQSEESDQIVYSFLGSQVFLRGNGEPDIFLIDEIWETRDNDGKKRVVKDKADGKCSTLLLDNADQLAISCTVKGRTKFPEISYKFSGKRFDPTKEGNAEDNAKRGDRGA